MLPPFDKIFKEYERLYVKVVKVLVIQSCPILCDPMDCSPSGSSVHRILQARVLFPSPGALPDPGIGLGSPTLQADSTDLATKEDLILY